MIAKTFNRRVPGLRNMLTLYCIFHILKAIRTKATVNDASDARKHGITRAAEIHAEGGTVEIFATLENRRHQHAIPVFCLVNGPGEPDRHRFESR